MLAWDLQALKRGFREYKRTILPEKASGKPPIKELLEFCKKRSFHAAFARNVRVACATTKNQRRTPYLVNGPRSLMQPLALSPQLRQLTLQLTFRLKHLEALSASPFCGWHTPRPGTSNPPCHKVIAYLGRLARRSSMEKCSSSHTRYTSVAPAAPGADAPGWAGGRVASVPSGRRMGKRAGGAPAAEGPLP